ncbi:ABC transporter substrate-binding protein [Actinocorallia sp. API 0066]|uniref:ABC transporter substrate-binding protein n=1 Tax=Actinocorallia sp. API 0066 TaxID=2896846 RepID=UPI001E294C31|nr:ABC transporter substrate-binding protein [Actinocorallia sp. API 0066]MCD0452314.1 ABC transporter substrate-binding protein [Actinocorallia sp. API 0066]
MKIRNIIAGIAVLAVTATACSGKSADNGGETGSDGVKTGPGVTADKITLGSLTDLTGVYATLGKSITQAQQLYFDELNAAGGVCGRTIEVLVRDHGYDVQKAVTAYTEVQSKVAGLPQVIGSPVMAAIGANVANDKIMTIPAAWPSALLKAPYVQVVGSTYELEMANGIDFLLKEKGIKSGDKIGHVYFEGEYGESALAGSKYAAEKAGLKLVEQRIKPTDTDMTSQVSALKAEGVKAILISAGPRQSASLAGVAAAGGFAVPIVSSSPGYSPQLLGTAAKPALEALFYQVSSVAPSGVDTPGMKALVAAYEKKHPGELLDSGVTFGYIGAMVFGEALKKACAAKDLTREGIYKAHQTQSAFDSNGLGVPLDFSKPGQPGTRQTYIHKPDSKAKGGTTLESGPGASEAANSYPFS